MLRKPAIYLETTIFNFPFADDAPHYKADTLRLFEEIKAGKYEPYTSVYTTDELQSDPDQNNRDRMMQLIGEYHIKVLEKDDASESLATYYIQEGAVKAAYPTDARHIAIAVVNGLDFIVSLNFQHIVKRKTIEATARINIREGYRQIGIYQPSEVIDDDNENDW